jgi:tetratricopeptide (TPR) repeat protein
MAAFVVPLTGSAPLLAQQQDFEVLYIEAGEKKPAHTPIDPTDLPRLHSNESSRGKLYDKWFLYHSAGPDVDLDEANRLFREVLLTFRREGFLSESRVAGAFAYQAYQAIETGDPGLAVSLFRKAHLLGPGMSSIHTGLGRAGRMDGGRLGDSLRWRLRGLAPMAGHLRATVPFFGNLFLVAGLALALAGTLAVILLVIRHEARWRHDLAEQMTAFAAPEFAAIIAGAVLFLPAFLWISPVWLVAFWMVFLFPYFHGSERFVAVCVLTGLLLLFPVLTFLGGYASFWWDPRVEELMTLADGGYSRESVEVMTRMLEEEPLSPDLQALLAQSYSDGGYSNEAYAQYRQILDSNPNSAWVYNNMGNLYLRSQQYGSAMQQYRRAIETDPLLVEPVYNLHIAHLEQFQIEEAEELLREAQKIAPERTSRWVEEGKKHPWLSGVLLPVDIRVPTERLVAEAMQLGAADPDGAPGTPFPRWKHTATFAGAAGLVGLVLLVVMRKKGKGVARRCHQCSRVYCRRCQKERTLSLCSQCHHLLTKRANLSTSNRAAKIEEISRYEAGRKRRLRFLTLTVPGAAHLLGGRTIFGMGILLIWCTSGALIVTRSLRIPVVEVPWAVVNPLGWVVPILLIAAAWIMGNLSPCTRKA